MAALCRSQTDMGKLSPQPVYGLLLGVWGIGAAFVALGMLQLARALIAWRYLHRRH